MMFRRQVRVSVMKLNWVVLIMKLIYLDISNSQVCRKSFHLYVLKSKLFQFYNVWRAHARILKARLVPWVLKTKQQTKCTEKTSASTCQFITLGHEFHGYAVFGSFDVLRSIPKTENRCISEKNQATKPIMLRAPPFRVQDILLPWGTRKQSTVSLCCWQKVDKKLKTW
jgi:hypothetical protein